MTRPIVEALPIGLNPRGKILKFANKATLRGSGELYFSAIDPLRTKGWKLHNEMTMRLGVVSGEVSFCFYDFEESYLETVTLDFSSNALILVPPKVWFAFRNCGMSTSVVVNLASIEHDENELVRRPLSSFRFMRNPI